MAVAGYPRARARQTLLPSGSSPGAAVPPSFRNWAYRVGVVTNNARTIVVSPPFQGPAFISQWSMSWPNAGTTGAGIGLWWSDDNSGQGQNLAGSVRPSGQPILDQISWLTPAKANTFEDLNVIDLTDIGALTLFTQTFDVRYYIQRPGTFYLKINLRNGAAGTHDNKGLITLQENVTPEQLAGFR